MTDRIVEVDAAKNTSRGDDNYNDGVTHEACETLLVASRYFREKYLSVYYSARGKMFSHLKDLCDSVERSMKARPEIKIAEMTRRFPDEVWRESHFRR